MDQAQVIDIITGPKNFTGLADATAASPSPVELVSFAYTQRYCSSIGTFGKWRNVVTSSIEQIFTFAGTAKQAFTLQLPAYSIVLACATTVDAAVTLSTAVKFGIGSGNAAGNGTDSNLFLSDATMTFNHQVINWPTNANSANSQAGAYVNANSATALTLYLNACDTGGSGVGSITSGTIRANIVYVSMYLPATHP